MADQYWHQLFQAVRLNSYHEFIFMAGEADINCLNEYSQNLLHEAAAYSSLGCAVELLKRNIDVNHQENIGMTPLHYCAANGSYGIAEEILRGGKFLWLSDTYGNEPLWTAVFNARGNYDFVRLFLKYGANSEHKNNNKKSPIDFARQINDVELVSILGE